MRRFHEPFRTQVIDAAWRTGHRREFVESTLRKWEANAKLEPCESEAKGRSFGIEDGCACVGCRERRLVAFFVAARQNFGPGATS